MKAFYILLLATLFSISCNSVKRTQKFVSQGNYDLAIELATKKLQKDKDAKEYDAHIRILEEAFLKAKDDDTRHIAFLKKENNPAGAKEIYYTFLDLQARQDLIRPLLPLYSKEMGRKANFVFSDYSNDLLAAKDAYVKSLYQEASVYIQRNSKQDYRSAFNVLCELDEVQPNYRDVNQLKDDAHFRGTDFVFVTLNNHTEQFIPFRLEQDLLDFNTYGLDNFWTEYHAQRENGINYDLGIDLNFQTIQISPERISDRQYTRSQRIKDGYDYRRDRGGNIVKDSLGNPIKIDKYIDVSATIYITNQQKSVFVGGAVVYKDLNKGRQLNSFPLSSEFVFENSFATYRGDKRALNGEDLNHLNNQFIPFPNNEQMVFDAGTDIKERFKVILRDNKFN
ncbi:hypothetical protein Aeqsu_2457 [Aequorivita sublithincola DSM 14238]|uniref:Uncharacterized protein n=1 Tax=Aequorivita sublithincola (strain DSM 14238 / LMG 21431 / ACAM 643 / 9-3) TaxID=746697 RepID=I3YY47_AEQSU|nr:hypothetical protein [Aequorivita sublithincola]AFL81915.1 hypothetical protein Aeqsu_2457 [Aequorivita sublithincola DSM 14238]